MFIITFLSTAPKTTTSKHNQNSSVTSYAKTKTPLSVKNSTAFNLTPPSAKPYEDYFAGDDDDLDFQDEDDDWMNEFPEESLRSKFTSKVDIILFSSRWCLQSGM